MTSTGASSGPDVHELAITRVIDLCRMAGDAILEIHRRGFGITHKRDASPVTQADLASHEILVRGLAELLADVPVLSEEHGAAVPDAQRLNWRRHWLVDPLDGTREFISGRDEFTINVALIEDHVAVFGVVHAPVLGLTYWGSRGHGAHRQCVDGKSVTIHAETRARHPVRVLASRSHADEYLHGYLAALGEHELHAAGSALKFCRLAEGAADLYPRFGPTCEWDTAAGQAIAEAAGATVVDLAGRPLRYNTRPGLVNDFFLVYGDRSEPWLSYVPAALSPARSP